MKKKIYASTHSRNTDTHNKISEKLYALESLLYQEDKEKKKRERMKKSMEEETGRQGTRGKKKEERKEGW